MMRRTTFLFLLMTALCVMLPAHAGDQDAADAAVADILFDYDGSGEFASYAVDESGNVDLTMAVDTPDEIYIEILDRMRSHADINSVLAGKTGSACGLWPN